MNSNGNELANKAAKETVIEASTLTTSLTESYTDVYGYIKQDIRPKWQRPLEQIKLWSLPFSTHPKSSKRNIQIHTIQGSRSQTHEGQNRAF